MSQRGEGDRELRSLCIPQRSAGDIPAVVRTRGRGVKLRDNGDEAHLLFSLSSPYTLNLELYTLNFLPRAMREQKFSQSLMLMRDRLIERRPSSVLLHVRIGAVGEEGSGDRERQIAVRMRGRGMQGTYPHFIPRLDVSVGSARQEEIHDIGMTEEGGERQGEEPVGGVSVDERGIGIEQRGHASCRAGGGGLEDIEVDIMRQKDLDDRRLPVIDREKERRDPLAIARRCKRAIGLEHAEHRGGISRCYCVEEFDLHDD